MMSPITVKEGWLLRGPKIDRFDDVLDLKNTHGVRTIINLQYGLREKFFGDANSEVRWCYYLGINYFDFDLNGLFSAGRKDINCVLGIFHRSNPTIYVHCRHGEERTGEIIAIQRIVFEGWTWKQAYDEMLTLGCSFPNYLFYKSTLKYYEEHREFHMSLAVNWKAP